MSFRLEGHTADVRAVVEGSDLASLYQSAVDLVRELLVGSSPVEAREGRRLELSGEDDEERFFRFVRELVYLNDTDRFLPQSVRLVGPVVVEGERFDAERHRSERQLKAVTRHAYRLETRPRGGYRAELVFDL